MIFKQITEILEARKTQTRRVRYAGDYAQFFDNYPDADVTRVYTSHNHLRFRLFSAYAIVPKRGAKGIGRFIRITAIRCEFLHDITESDAIAEGVTSIAEYRALWESINGAGSWDKNPSVWVLSFKLEAALL